MSVEKRSLLFLFGLLVVLYLTKITPFLDEYTMGRFTVWTLLAYGGLWLVLPYLRRTDVQVLDWSLLAFYCLNLLSVSWAKNFGEAIFTSQKYLLLFVGYYVLRHLLAEGKVHRDQMAKLLLGLSAFVVVLTTYQMAQTYLSEGLGGKAIYKVISLSGHKNLAASYLFLLLCLNIFFAIRRPKAPWFYWLLGFQVLLLLLLRSRAVYLALGTSALISGGYYLTSSVSLRRLALRRVLPFALLLALFGGLLIGNTGVGKDYLRHLNPDTYLTSGSGSERLFVWYKTWDLIVDQPWLGCGSGNWKLLFPSKNLSGGYRLQEKDVVFTRVHNDLLEVWAEVGTLGLLLFLVIFGWAFAAAVDRLRRGKLVDQQEGIVLIATLVGYLVVSFFDFPKERPEHQVLLSLLLAIAAFRGKEWLAKRPAYFSLSPTARHKGSLILSFVLLVNLPICYYRSVANISGEKVIVGMATRDTKLMITHARRGHSIWYSVNPTVIPLKWYEGLAHYYDGDYAAARAPFAAAYVLNPYNFNVANNYASTLVQLGEYEAAIPLYLQALEINPKFEEGMFNLAFSFFQMKRYPEALEWVNKVETNQEKKAVFLQNIRSAQQ